MTEGQSGPPPGWPAPAPLAGEFGPGMTVAGDPGFAPPPTMPPPPGELPLGMMQAGAVAPTQTAYDPLLVAVPGPVAPYAAPIIMPASRAPNSRAPLLVGILALSVAMVGGIGFYMYRRSAAAEDDKPTEIAVPKAKKKKVADQETAKPKETAAAPTPTPTDTAEPTPTPTAEPTATTPAPTATTPAPTATTPPKPTATTPPKPTATTPPKPTATTPPRPRIPRPNR